MSALRLCVEALRDLEAEGLVTIFPHRRAVVTELSQDDLRDIYAVRATLEGMATRLAVPNLTEEHISSLFSLIDQMDTHIKEIATIVKLNSEFHMTIYRASNRRHLFNIIRMLRYRTQHYLHAYIDYFGGMPLAQSEHRLIIDCIKRGDSDLSATIVSDHVTQVGESIIEYVRQQSEKKDQRAYL